MGGQINKAHDYQYKHHRVLLDYRGQDRIVESESFTEAWKLANEKDKLFLAIMLRKPNPSRMKKWILQKLVGGLDQYTTKVLRQIASYNQIPQYSRMTKPQLVQTLTSKGVTDGSADI